MGYYLAWKHSRKIKMKQRWEIVHWPNNKRVQLCDSKEIAVKLLPYHGKSHIVREVWFYDDGTHYVRFNVEWNLKMVEVRIGNSLKVIGEFVIIHADGTEEVVNGKRAFCRCGLSSAMPFCDQTHKTKMHWVKRVPYERGMWRSKSKSMPYAPAVVTP